MLSLGGLREADAPVVKETAPSVWVFAGTPETPQRVRNRLRAWGEHARLGPQVIEHLLLVASELVTNAVRHCGGGVVVRVMLEHDDILLEVSDGDTGEPRRTDHESPLATGGRGLVVVGALAHSWGVGQAGSGKVVWVRMPARVTS
jgi:anti-sigma regulatory factor (Ser/Thr protein kinase)